MPSDSQLLKLTIKHQWVICSELEEDQEKKECSGIGLKSAPRDKKNGVDFIQF